jgi:hypothetical protein
MKEKILAFLKTKLTGVQDAFLQGVADNLSKTIKEETQIETIINDGVIESLRFSATQIQTEGDRRANEAVRTAVTNYEKKHNLKDGKIVAAGGEQTPPDPNEPEWFRNYRSKQEQETATLRAKVEGYEKQGNVEQLTSKVKAKLIEKKIPESYFKGRNLAVESEEHIDKLITDIEGDFTAFKQELVNQGVVTEVPKGGTPTSSSSSAKADIENLATKF